MTPYRVAASTFARAPISTRADSTSSRRAAQCIAVMPSGEMGWSFNSDGMYRARIGSGHDLDVALYGEEATA